VHRYLAVGDSAWIGDDTREIEPMCQATRGCGRAHLSPARLGTAAGIYGSRNTHTIRQQRDVDREPQIGLSSSWILGRFTRS
jgi:hypothetical protein